MEKAYKFAVDDFKKINLADYEEDEFMVGHLGYLSTMKNSHGLVFSEEVLRRDASTVLGKFLVADMTKGVDAGTHTSQEKIVGFIPKEQTVEFVEEDDGSLKAYVDVVISKIYARDFCRIFESNSGRSVSMEAIIETTDNDSSTVVSFRVMAVTVLGVDISPSVPNADLKITRFSEKDYDAFFMKVKNNSLTSLQKFAKERKEKMAEKKTYTIDKSKEAMSDKSWSDVDKTELRNKIMEAANRDSLVKAVYMKVEEGWQDAPSEKLSYPVMEIKGDKAVYNRNGLSSALGYAKKENETAVVSKIEKIYKKLDLDESNGKEDKAKMSKEIEFAAVNIGDMWCRLWDTIRDKRREYCIEGIYEEDNQKFAILVDGNGDLYRLDFSLTEDEGLVVAGEITQVKKEFIETDNVMKFAEPENVEQYKKFDDDEDDEDDKKDEEDKDDEDDDKPVEMSADEMKDKIAQMEKDIEEKENIIMEKDKELEELREFKRGVEEKEKMMAVEAILSEVKEFMSEDSIKSLREEGKALSKDQIDAFANKVKAQAFEFSANTKKNKKTDVWSFAAPNSFKENKSKSVWDRI